MHEFLKMKQLVFVFFLLSLSQFSFGQTVKCKCFDGIGSSENDTPVLTIEFDNGVNLSVCGYLKERKSNTEVILSEFDIFNCNTGQSVFQFGALQTYNIKSKTDSLIITELKYLPAGKNWKREFVPLTQLEIFEQDDTITASLPKSVYNEVDIDPTEVENFFNELEQLKGKGNNSELEIIVGKLEVLTLNGNTEAKAILNNFQEYFNCNMDGALQELWNDATSTVIWLKK